jgi:hypothetical protein
MKTTIFLRAASIALLAGSSIGVYAQGNRGGHHHGEHRHHDKHVHHHHRHCGHEVRVVHHHHHSPVERRVVYHHPRPVRYVYYRDYDVYYDYQRQVYISFGGRNWNVSAGLPVAMRHVDVHHATRVEVDEYYDDDFNTYLDTNRPGGRVYVRR